MDWCHQSDTTVVMGDLNAKVGGDNRGRERAMGSHEAGECNDSTEILR